MGRRLSSQHSSRVHGNLAGLIRLSFSLPSSFPPIPPIPSPQPFQKNIAGKNKGVVSEIQAPSKHFPFSCHYYSLMHDLYNTCLQAHIKNNYNRNKQTMCVSKHEVDLYPVWARPSQYPNTKYNMSLWLSGTCIRACGSMVRALEAVAQWYAH